MRKLLPVILIFLGLAVGGGVGILLQPKAADGDHAGAEGGSAGAGESAHASPADSHGGEAAKDDGHAAEEPAAADGHGEEKPEDGGHATDAGHGEGGKPKPDDSVEVIPAASDGHGGAETGGGFEYVKLSNQFIVPLVDHGQVMSMMVLTLSLEVHAGGGDSVYAREPKLRDALLQVLFDHANANGFAGRYTDAEAMMPLRRALREAAIKVLPDTVNDVLISDIVRHDS